MMRMKTKSAAAAAPPPTNAAGAESEWELRPGGMLVQKRSDSDHGHPPPTIRVRVKYGSTYHEVNISSQATFGELKKMLSAPTGLHHEDQKLFFKDKERDSKAFLDIVGVKDRSKIVLVEDPISQERRYLEMRKTAKMEKASRLISEISLEVDRLSGQVSALESLISKGGKVAENDVLNLIELLMNQLLRLDGIMADGDVKLQRKMQVRRVQKYVETLDLLKMKNCQSPSNKTQISHQKPPLHPHQKYHSNGQAPSPNKQKQQQQQLRHSFERLSLPGQAQSQQPPRSSNSGAVVITTQWETFDAGPAIIPASSATSSAASTMASSAQHKFNWDLL
ncbi:hypothetical protein NMG60_11018149 [Bertholletia excelsa]